MFGAMGFSKVKKYLEKAAYFDSQADAQWANEQYGPQELAKLEKLFSRIQIAEGMHILEPGCGTGRLTDILSKRIGPAGFVLALDISPKMVEAARRRLIGRKNVEVHLDMVERFRLRKNAFDLVICHQVFPHFEDKQRVLEIFYDVLKPLGKLIIFHFINLAQINDRHRKAGTAVQNDMMPEIGHMEKLLGNAGLIIDHSRDDSIGYLLIASCKKEEVGFRSPRGHADPLAKWLRSG